jgi:hypothetical protein
MQNTGPRLAPESPRGQEIAPEANGSTTSGAEAPKVANPETCRIARGNLHALDTAGRIQKIDDDGEPYFLTEEDKAIERDRARALIRLHCRPEETPEKAP